MPKYSLGCNAPAFGICVLGLWITTFVPRNASDAQNYVQNYFKTNFLFPHNFELSDIQPLISSIRNDLFAFHFYFNFKPHKTLNIHVLPIFWVLHTAMFFLFLVYILAERDKSVTCLFYFLKSSPHFSLKGFFPTVSTCFMPSLNSPRSSLSFNKQTSLI